MKRRCNGEGTINQRSSDGRWIGNITIGIDSKTGKAVRKSCSAKTQAECKTKLDALKKQYQGITAVRKDITSKTVYTDYLLHEWLAEKQNVEKLEESTIATHRARIKCYFTGYFRKTTIGHVTSQRIIKFYGELGDKISAETIHKIHAIINNSFSKLIRDGVVVVNPCTGIRLPTVHHHEKEALTDDECETILHVAEAFTSLSKVKGKNMYVYISLALVTGLRRGEMCALTWDKVDFQRNKIKVDRAIAEIDGKMTGKRTKTDASIRYISVPPSMTAMLQHHHDTYATGTYVFPNSNNKEIPQSPSSVCKQYKAILKIAGIESSLHILRHTNITNMITAGVNLKTVKQRAGHSRIETTMGYTHPADKYEQEAGMIFDKFLNNSDNSTNETA